MFDTLSATDLELLATYDIPSEECVRIASLLRARTNAACTASDYCMWVTGDGDGDYDRFDNAARTLLGDELYDAGEQTARLDGVLIACLEGKKTVTIGGITFKDLPQQT